jgi:hypothetical protein
LVKDIQTEIDALTPTDPQLKYDQFQITITTQNEEPPTRHPAPESPFAGGHIRSNSKHSKGGSKG